MSCPISFPNTVTRMDLVDLEMVDFYVILGIDMLHTYFASIDCRTILVKFNFPNELVLEWNKVNSILRGHTISCLKSCKMISKGCIYHILRVNGLESHIPFIELIPVVKYFLKSFRINF